MLTGKSVPVRIFVFVISQRFVRILLQKLNLDFFPFNMGNNYNT